MPKYLVKGNYEAAGTKGLIKDGGSGRKAAVTKAVKGLGGKVEGIYFAFGEADVYAVINMPDQASSVAFSLAVNATGLARISMTPLLTAEEIDAACKKTVAYRGPGA